VSETPAEDIMVFASPPCNAGIHARNANWFGGD